MAENRRIQRVEKELQQIIAQSLIQNFKEPLMGFPTVTRVSVSKDLRQARVFLSFMGINEKDQQQDLESIQSRAKDFSYDISRRLRMKFSPKLRFEVDHGIEHQLKIERMLKNL